MGSFEKLKTGLKDEKYEDFISMLVIFGIKDMRFGIKNHEIILRDINKIPSDNEIELSSFMILIFNINFDQDLISVKNDMRCIEDLELISKNSEIEVIFLKIKEMINNGDDIKNIKNYVKKYFILYFPNLALKSKVI